MIQLSDGRGFDLQAPRVPSIQVIAASSAKLCRFVGHVTDFYSVAQHSVLVSQIVDPKWAMAALLHDASETITGDCSSPLKAMLQEFRWLENRYQFAINETYCPELNHDQVCIDAVRAADLAMLAAERYCLMPAEDPDGVWDWVERTIVPAQVNVKPVCWEEAGLMFLRRYDELRVARLRERGLL